MVKLKQYRNCSAKSLILYLLYSGVIIVTLFLVEGPTVKVIKRLTSVKQPATVFKQCSHERIGKNETQGLRGSELGGTERFAHRDSLSFSRNSSDSLTHGVPELDAYIVNNIVDKAKAIFNDIGSPIYFMMFAEAYKYLALNWLCNTAAFEGTHERLLIVTTSKSACSIIRRKWGTVGSKHFSQEYNICQKKPAMLISHPIVFLTDAENKQSTCVGGLVALFCVTLAPKEHTLDWTNQKSFGYASLRAYLLLKIIKNAVEVIALEPDSVWLRNPSIIFRKISSRPDVDIATPLNAGAARIGEWRANSPMLVRPTEASTALLNKLLDKLRKHSDSELVVFNNLCITRYSGVICDNFLYEDISDGKWFALEETEKRLLRPYILSNNYLNGRKKKENRQKKFGLWFLSEQGQCNHQAVKRKLDSFSRAVDEEHLHGFQYATA